MTTKRRRRKRGRYHRGVHVSPKAGECRYRSGWESVYMVHLDADPDVVAWSYEKTPVPYVSNVRTGRTRTYYPDFYVEYVDGRRMLVEVKPKRKTTQATVMKKAKAAREWCEPRGLTYVILTEVDLRSIGLL